MIRLSDLVGEESEKSKEPVRFSDVARLHEKGDSRNAPLEPKKRERTEEMERAISTYESFQDFLKDVKKKITENAPISFENILLLTDRLIHSNELLEHMYRLSLTYGHGGDYLISHSVNTMVYALKIAMRMGYPRPKLLELALGALIYDVGLFLIPEEIINKNGPLTESEVSLIRNHPEIGKKALSALGEMYPWILRVVYEHHERENGQGYPQGLKGNDIHEYAKIIGLCDTYEAMTHDRPYRKALMQFVSVRDLVEAKNLLFSPRILKIFLEEISLYPVGSYVKLNNKTIGKVIATNSGQPLKPVIQLLFDSNGNRIVEDKIINLVETPVLVIIGGVTEEELPERVDNAMI